MDKLASESQLNFILSSNGDQGHQGLNNFFISPFQPIFLQLVFKLLISVQTGFLIRAWQPSGLDY